MRRHCCRKDRVFALLHICPSESARQLGKLTWRSKADASFQPNVGALPHVLKQLLLPKSHRESTALLGRSLFLREPNTVTMKRLHEDNTERGFSENWLLDDPWLMTVVTQSVAENLVLIEQLAVCLAVDVEKSR